jgi:hypothetical protein
MQLSIGIRVRAASLVPSRIVMVMLVVTTPFAYGQEFKTASTLGFSVYVQGRSSAQRTRSQVARLVVDGETRRVSIPLGTESALEGGATSTVQLIARFRVESMHNVNGLSARIDHGELRSFAPEEKTMTSVLTIANKPLSAGASYLHDRVVELQWTTTNAESASNILEIEIRQY